MSKSLAASKKLMQSYLSELLNEDVEPKLAPQAKESSVLPVKEKQAQPLESLLNNASLLQVAQEVEEAVQTRPLSSAKASNKDLFEKPQVKTKHVKTIHNDAISPSIKSKAATKEPNVDVSVKKADEIKTRKSLGGFTESKPLSYRQGDFQAMFFEVAGLIIAVPLVELGGIHSNNKATPLMGKPDWFKGVMLHRDEKINVVDTALWVMPEKCDQALLSALNYQYIIMLNNSEWGLSAEKLIDTVTLKQEDVKWLDTPNKRPWLAGLVKNRMCALLDVDSLIKLLEKGANIKQD
ncbi:MAG: purine-binding chemotaxis protein CheW [Colwellia polaris]|jgi:purine-binding chemotaxis protein CheW